MFNTTIATKPIADRKRAGLRVSTAFVGLMLLALPPAAAHAVNAESKITYDAVTGSVSTVSAGVPLHRTIVGLSTPALTPGLPPPQMPALSDRRIVAGIILVLFAGLSALTVGMWRELGRRMDA